MDVNYQVIVYLMVLAGAPQAGGSRVFLTPLAASPDPLRQSQYKLSI